MLEFNTYSEPITETDLQNLELLIGKELPNDYKNHMLEYNGCRVSFKKSYLFNFKNEEF